MAQPFAIETSTIGLTLWNPTTENLDMQYAGVSLTLKAGEKQTYEISCAKHLLNGFGQRGLTSLPYGADEEKIGAAARERNTAFKKKQVIEYNQRNENRKHMGMSYHPPTEAVKLYAIELGLEMLEPYRIRDEERGQIADAKQENQNLKAELAELREMLKTILAGQKKYKPIEPIEEELTAYVCSVCGKKCINQIALDGHKDKVHGIS